MQDKMAKEALGQYYFEHYGVTVTSQQLFVLTPERLRELLIKKATAVMWDKAARKIQGWVLGRLRRRAFLKLVKNNVKATITIQRFWRWWVSEVLRPI